MHTNQGLTTRHFLNHFDDEVKKSQAKWMIVSKRMAIITGIVAGIFSAIKSYLYFRQLPSYKAPLLFAVDYCRFSIVSLAIGVLTGGSIAVAPKLFRGPWMTLILKIHAVYKRLFWTHLDRFAQNLASGLVTPEDIPEALKFPFSWKLIAAMNQHQRLVAWEHLGVRAFLKAYEDPRFTILRKLLSDLNAGHVKQLDFLDNDLFLTEISRRALEKQADPLANRRAMQLLFPSIIFDRNLPANFAIKTKAGEIKVNKETLIANSQFFKSALVSGCGRGRKEDHLFIDLIDKDNFKTFKIYLDIISGKPHPLNKSIVLDLLKCAFIFGLEDPMIEGLSNYISTNTYQFSTQELCSLIAEKEGTPVKYEKLCEEIKKYLESCILSKKCLPNQVQYNLEIAALIGSLAIRQHCALP